MPLYNPGAPSQVKPPSGAPVKRETAASRMVMDVRIMAATSGFWLGVAVLSPCFVPRSENRSVIRCMLVCAAVCMYLSWLCTYLAQINPLVGPMLPKPALLLVEEYWAGGKDNHSDAAGDSSGHH